MLTFYNRYLDACTAKGVSPSYAAEAAGLSRAAPTGWKKGALPSDVNLNKLANYFGVPVSEFLKCDDIMERNHIKEAKEILERETYEANNSEGKKITATKSDGVELSEDAIRIAGNLEELKKLADRLTPQEVEYFVSEFRKTILGL